MLGWIILLFLAMPFIEFYLLIEIGQRIGFVPTLAIVLGTGLLGGLLVRWQGVTAVQDVLGAVRQGRAPTTELAAGALFLLAAGLLLTPGVITDVFGFAMMVPPLRRALAGYLVGRVRESDRVQTHVSVGANPFGGGPGGPGGEQGRQGYDVETTGYTKDEETDGEPISEPDEEES